MAKLTGMARHVSRLNTGPAWTTYAVTQRLMDTFGWLWPAYRARAAQRRVKLVCGSCGTVAAVVDEDPAGVPNSDYPGLLLIVRCGNRAHRHMQAVSCRRHGKLDATWERVLPLAQAARDGRVRTLRIRSTA